MSVQLKELLEKIKQEGVREAEQEADRIRRQAEEEARRIRDTARREADAELEKRRDEAARFEAAGREAVKQAGRDLVLSIRREITGLFERILKAEVQEGLDDPKVLADAVTALLEAWGESRVGDVEIEVPESVVKDVQSSVMERLKGKLKEGVEITPSPRVNRGFRVSEKEGSAYFDFTDEGITEFLMEYLNPRVAELLKGNAS